MNTRLQIALQAGIIASEVFLYINKKLGKRQTMEVLKFLQYEVVIAGRKEMVSNAIKIYCHSVFDAINDMDTSLIKFYRNEL